MSSSAFLHAPPFSATPATTRASPSSNTAAACSSMTATARIAVVGDVHDQWNLEEDTKALQLLRFPWQCSRIWFYLQAGYLFHRCLPGDFGNENVELVQSIADLKFPKAAILGNHDSWTTQKFSSKKKDRVQLQLESLGDEHVGYSRLDFEELKISVVGGRPFSCGGDQMYRKRLLSARYGVQDMEGSVRKICNATSGTPDDNLVILLAHNGPTGLGSKINDICGKDWSVGGGDHGDPDLAQALSRIKEFNKLCIPLIIFGHMHKELAYRNGLRKMIVVADDGTIYLNGAIVPRVKDIICERKANGVEIEINSSDDSNLTTSSTQDVQGTRRAFTLVEIVEGRVEKIAETWVSVLRDDEAGVVEEQVLFDRSHFSL